MTNGLRVRRLVKGALLEIDRVVVTSVLVMGCALIQVSQGYEGPLTHRRAQPCSRPCSGLSLTGHEPPRILICGQNGVVSTIIHT